MTTLSETIRHHEKRDSFQNKNNSTFIEFEAAVRKMKIIFFTHPDFLGHVSMPRFSRMLVEGMKNRGHSVETWSPTPRFYNLTVQTSIKKWLGYIDQYVVFPMEVRNRLKGCSKDTLFVFTDNALGPWIPLVMNFPHVMHCHDFMAQDSARGLVPENPTGWTGRQYQKLIFRGYSKGKNFISGSENTRKQLHQFLPSHPLRSELVYNGLNQVFAPIDPHNAKAKLEKETGLTLSEGYLLHVGGNQWYKNRVGVIEMYDAWRAISNLKLPLLLMGLPPSAKVLRTHAKSPHQKDIHFFKGAKDKIIRLAYAGALVFLFPSKAEGFGWPIAEAMASGCPVITTNEPPMTEVAGNAGFFIPRRPYDKSMTTPWANEAAKVMDKVLNLSPLERQAIVQAGLTNAKRFDTKSALDKIESIYHEILHT